MKKKLNGKLVFTKSTVARLNQAEESAAVGGLSVNTNCIHSCEGQTCWACTGDTCTCHHYCNATGGPCNPNSIQSACPTIFFCDSDASMVCTSICGG